MSAAIEPENVVIKTLARLTNRLPIGRGVEQHPIRPIGWKTHHKAVELLMFSLDNVPADHHVRLDKKTSNLLRIRTAAQDSAPEEKLVLLEPEKLNGVIAIDRQGATADVQGMCTYEDLVDATLSFGLAPLVVPSLKTITIGGAIAGSLTESTSFRNGLPQASVLEMDILTGTGEVLTCSPTENAELFRAFPNSYGTLGYAVRVKIELEPVLDYVELHHVRFDDLSEVSRALADIAAQGTHEGRKVDYLDGVVFSPTESYLVLGTQTAEPGAVSDYTHEDTYYESLRHRAGVAEDRLSIRDYLWRWDTDWFWNSRDLGAQHPTVRKLWPPDLLRASFYSRLLKLDQKFHIAERIDGRAGKPTQERVAQTVEIPAAKLLDFLTWLLETSDIEPVWLCPVRLLERGGDVLQGTSVGGSVGGISAGQQRWLLSPLTTHTTWVDVGIWASVPADILGEDAPENAFSRAVEKKAKGLGGHTLLYSDSFYSREEFSQLYGGPDLADLKAKFDPHGRFPELYDKVVRGA